MQDDYAFTREGQKAAEIADLKRRNSAMYEGLRKISKYRWHLNNMFKTDRQIAEDVFEMVDAILERETAEITADTLRGMDKLDRGEFIG